MVLMVLKIYQKTKFDRKMKAFQFFIILDT